MLEIGFALLIAGGLLFVSVVLPVLSFIRAQQAQRAAAAAEHRVRRLEGEVARLAEALRQGRATTPAVPATPKPETTVSAATRVVPLPTAPAAGPPPAIQPPAPLPPVVIKAPESARPRAAPEDFEQQIGSRWLLYAGIAAVVLGMSYFVKFAFDNGWISEPLRVLSGVAIGLGLVAAGMRFWSRGLAPFGQALAGGGVVVLYVAIYAALHFYQLVTAAPAFALMVLVTAAAAWLADRQRSQPMAALALIGGFATPLLVGGERGVQLVLFTYIAILVSGSAVLARRHTWPLLSAVSYLGTFALVVAWFFSSYEAEDWLRTELFLTLYAALFAYLLGTLVTAPEKSSPQAQLAVAALTTAPFAYHLASIVLLNERPAAWLLYLVLVTISGLIVSQRTRTPWLRVVVLLVVGIPALVWLESLRFPRWYAAAVTTTVVLYVLHLVAQWEASDEHGGSTQLPVMETIHTQANGLLLPLSLYFFFADRAAAWNPWIVGVLAGWNGVLAAAARTRAPRMSLQFVALSATLAAVTVALAFDGPAVAVGWAAEGVLVGWLASRERSRILAFGSTVLIALGSIQLVQLLTASLPVGELPFLNPRALGTALVVALLAWLAWRTRDDPEAEVRGRARDGLILTVNVLAILLLSAEIHAYFDQRALAAAEGATRSTAAAAGLAEQLTLSVTWALYAVVLIAAGIRRRYAPARYLGIALFGLTVTKVLMHDIAGLDRFYRMMTVLGVGILLLVASYLYQRRSPDPQQDSV